MPGPSRRTRPILRYTHLAVGALLSTYVYLPPPLGEPLRLFLMFVGVPAVALTGVAMWKQAALRRLSRRIFASAVAGRSSDRVF